MCPQSWPTLILGRAAPAPNVAEIESEQSELVEARRVIARERLKDEFIDDDVIDAANRLIEDEKVRWDVVDTASPFNSTAEDVARDIFESVIEADANALVQLESPASASPELKFLVKLPGFQISSLFAIVLA
jgi:hypothetical protein